MVKYIVRLDDACPTMDKNKWDLVEQILDKYKIRPLVGVIPDNEDKNLKIDNYDTSFWAKARMWENKGWTIALHGYNHMYSTTCSGINPLWNRSEFAGLPLELQKKKIHLGMDILSKHGIHPKVFFAPSHTYDGNTIKALKEESDIRIISDTVALKPYRDNNITFVPVQFGSFRKVLIPGIYTFCFHPNTMTPSAMDDFYRFIDKNSGYFVSFEEASYKISTNKRCIDKVVSSLYFLLRKIRNLK